MPNILTPLSLWNGFNDLLDLSSEILATKTEDNVKIEYLNFNGRETEAGRVRIYAAYASDEKSPASETVLIFPDSDGTVDDSVMKMIVKRGYSALMVDYRGKWEGAERYTVYPSDISYANTVNCGRTRDFVDDSADKTCWYEWVAVAIYARKYAANRTNNESIAVIGIRDGGEIAWKLGVAKKMSCIVPINAAGWKAYAGINKFTSNGEAQLDEERYRFIAGVDSQSYAPYVRCPVLMLCTTNDAKFDYDRAYDTFSRINPDFVQDSVIAYSVQTNACVCMDGINDTFMFLDKHLKKRQVFIPKPAEIKVESDSDDNLIARVSFDSQGIIENCRLYLAEDCVESSVRDWELCPFKAKVSDNVHDFYLNLYTKTTTVFVLCAAKFGNGFTVWSKIAVKKISGKFRNMTSRCRVLFTGSFGATGFAAANDCNRIAGGIFLADSAVLPSVVEKVNGVKGLYSPCGLTTFRINNPKYAPSESSLLKLDFCCDKDGVIEITVYDVEQRETYAYTENVLGKVWQSLNLESGAFKTKNGSPLPSFCGRLKLTVRCDSGYAVNNVMWL